jgi:hypothetical protein
MIIAYRLGSALTAAVLVTFLATSIASADTTLEISGNGSKSDNKIDVTTEKGCEVIQENNTNVTSIIGVSSSTGGNTASGNTGGDTDITTGKVSTDITVVVQGGENIATDPCCCDNGCPLGDTSLLISGNGDKSNNYIKVEEKNESLTTQLSDTSVTSVIGVKSKTGKNKAKNNTGGSTTIKTGKVNTKIDLSVFGGSNLIGP